jgi:uncharacterized protein YdaU (DUF1376 family)
MTKLPYMPMFVDDFFGGTLRWTGEQQSLYALLLMHQWASGPLPLVAADIANAIHYEPKKFALLWKSIQKKFVHTDEGWVNVKCEEVRTRSIEIAGERSRAGKKGVEARARIKQEQSTAQAIAEANEQAIASGLQPICSSIQSNPSKNGVRGFGRKES